MTFVIATVLLLRGSKSTGLNQGKLTLRSQQAPHGRRKHTRNTGSSHCQADLPDLSFSVIWGRLLLIDWIPLTINELAVSVLLFTIRDLYLLLRLFWY